MFLLGDRYIDSLEKMADSQNTKFFVYPADIQNTLKGLIGSLSKN